MRIKSLLLGLCLGTAFFILIPVILFDLRIMGHEPNEWYSLPFLAVFTLAVSWISRNFLRGIAVGMSISLLALWTMTIAHPLMGIVSVLVVNVTSILVSLRSKKSEGNATKQIAFSD